jgi:hypothetical protein
MALERDDAVAFLEKLFNQRCDQIEKKIDAGFTRTNGRIDHLEDVVGGEGDQKGLVTRVGILEDRGNRDTTARAQGLGGIASSVALWLWQTLKN